MFHYPGSDFRLRIPELCIEHGSTVAVIGPSGTGKTTLLDLVAGVRVPDAGSITTDGKEMASLNDRQRRAFRMRNIGLVFQEFELLEYLNVLDNILLPYRINSALELTGWVRVRAELLANSVGIEDKLKRNVHQLSQGERQRVAVCRALITEPPLLLCDEPTGNLDPDNKDQVLDILFDYVTTNETTLVTVTHDRDMLERFERVIDFREFQPGNRPSTGDCRT
jgi:putative ABC transport system ATP-binding protein